MATISRVNGQVAPGAFYGYSPLVVRVADAGNHFTVDTGGSGVAIVEGGYTKAVRAFQAMGSLVLLGVQGNAAICAIVDGPTFNRGGGAITAGDFGALKDAIVLAIPTVTVGQLTVTFGSALDIAGAFTLA